MAQSKTVLMQNIQRSANAVGAIDPDGFTTSLIGRDQAEALLRLCGVCLTNLASALKSDVEADEPFLVTLHGQSTPQAMTLAQCQTWCSEIRTLASECVYRFRIHQALLQAHVWVSDMQEPEGLSEEQAMFAAETGNILLQTLQDALEAGVSECITVELNDAHLSLAQVRQVGLYVAAADSLCKTKMNFASS